MREVAFKGALQAPNTAPTRAQFALWERDRQYCAGVVAMLSLQAADAYLVVARAASRAATRRAARENGRTTGGVGGATYTRAISVTQVLVGRGWPGRMVSQS